MVKCKRIKLKTLMKNDKISVLYVLILGFTCHELDGGTATPQPDSYGSITRSVRGSLPLSLKNYPHLILHGYYQYCICSTYYL